MDDEIERITFIIYEFCLKKNKKNKIADQIIDQACEDFDEK